MIVWPRLPLAVYACAILAVLSAVAGWWVNGMRWQSRLNAERLEHAQALAAGYRAGLEKYDEANRRALQAESRIRDLMALSSKRRVIYRDAVKGEPRCAEQASQPLVCPRPW